MASSEPGAYSTTCRLSRDGSSSSGGNSPSTIIEPTKTLDHTTGNAVITTANTANRFAVTTLVLPTNSHTMMTNDTTANLKTLIPGTPNDSMTIEATGLISTPLKNKMTRVSTMSSDAKKTNQRYRFGNSTTARCPSGESCLEKCSAATCIMIRRMLLRSPDHGPESQTLLACQSVPSLRRFQSAHPSQPCHRITRCGTRPASILRQP